MYYGVDNLKKICYLCAYKNFLPMNFWKTFGASLLAFVVASAIVVGSIIVLIFNLLLPFNVETESVPEQSVLYINLAEDITDAPSTSSFSNLDPTALMSMSGDSVTILQTLTAIENAAKDKSIKGICIYCDGDGAISVANIEELREALISFKNSGKFVVAYDYAYTQSEYYLASVADEILINPEGSLDWHGMGMTSLFFKGLMDKLDIHAEIFRPTTCKYKSAVEPYFRSDMSPANREQMEVLVNSMWNDIVDDIAESRNLNAEDLKRYAENLEINTPEDALSHGLVDRIAHEDELFDLFGAYGVKHNEFKLYNKVSLYDYVTYINLSPKCVSVGDRSALADVNNPLVAIIYAEGEIVDGNMYSNGYVFGSRLAEELRQARLDKQTKAVVVRVNSPGGSAMASELAWREMELLQQVKPVVISMGDMAASGGYYISAPADYIFADKLTLTGSIGVFGVIFNFEDALKNKLGVTTDTAATSPSGAPITVLRGLNEAQRASIMVGVDRVYTTFTTHVSEGRNLPIDHVLEIAEGRVWSGSNAVEIGLVDEIGGFKAVVAKAAQLAGITKSYKLYEFSAPVTPFEQFLNEMGVSVVLNMGINHNNAYFEEVHNFLMENPMLITDGGIKTIMPGDIKVEL